MAWIRWYRCKNGAPLASVVWRDHRGRHRSRALKTSDPEVAELHRRMIENQEEGKGSVIEQLDPMDALERFFTHLRVLQRSEETIDYYREKLKPLCEQWNHVRLHRWNRGLLEDYLASKTWSPRTTRMMITACRRFVAWCQDAGILCADFVGRMKAPRPDPRKVLAVTPEQVGQLLEEAHGKPIEVPVALAAFAGLSRADFLALDWSEVDLKHGWIRRKRSKTGIPIRIPVTKPLRAILKRHRAIGGPVVRGVPKSDSSLSKALHRLCDKAKVPRGGWHRFRHAFGTLMMEQGADLATIQAAMAHRPGSAVTLQYTHPDDKRLRQAVEAVARQIDS